MKKSLLYLLVATILSTNLMAEEKMPVDNKSYIGFGLGLQDALFYETGVSLVLNAGTSLPDIEVEYGEFGIEGELTYSAVKPSDIAFTTVAGYLTYKKDVNKDLYVNSKLGLSYVSSDDPFIKDALAPSAGFGLGVRHDEKADFYFDYTILRSSLANMTFGIRLKI